VPDRADLRIGQARVLFQHERADHVTRGRSVAGHPAADLGQTALENLRRRQARVRRGPLHFKDRLTTATGQSGHRVSAVRPYLPDLFRVRCVTQFRVREVLFRASSVALRYTQKPAVSAANIEAFYDPQSALHSTP
jgi:hypothetical protein